MEDSFLLYLFQLLQLYFQFQYWLLLQVVAKPEVTSNFLQFHLVYKMGPVTSMFLEIIQELWEIHRCYLVPKSIRMTSVIMVVIIRFVSS